MGFLPSKQFRIVPTTAFLHVLFSAPFGLFHTAMRTQLGQAGTQKEARKYSCPGLLSGGSEDAANPMQTLELVDGVTRFKLRHCAYLFI